MRDMRSVHEEFDRAIDDELEAIERSRRIDVVVTGSGIRVPAVPEGLVYRFHHEGRSGALRPGKEVAFEIEDGYWPGVVIRCTADAVFVRFDADLGESTPHGRLLADSRWLLRALQRRLRTLRQQGNIAGMPFNAGVAARALGIGNLMPGGGSIVGASAPRVSGLNREQQQLIETAFRLPSVALWGPSGTGKSEVALALVLALIAAGQRVLLLAPTNAAVDDLLERGESRFRGEEWFADGAVLRVGPIEGVTLGSRLKHDLCLVEVVKRRLGNSSTVARDAVERASLQLVRRARLVAATMTQAYLSPLLIQAHWDVLVVDEASMVSPATLFTAAGLADRCVIAGDFRQLPPVVTGDSVAVRSWLARDPFEVLGIPDDIERGDYPPYLVMLREQYRMAPGICELVSDSYDGRLVTHRSVLDRPSGPLGDKAVFYVDTGPAGSRVEIDRAGSRFNAVNVDISVGLLQRLLEREVLARSDLQRVLVVTPFAAQAHQLSRRMRQQFGRYTPAVRTIHRAQGREADLVLLDLVESRGQSASRFFAARTVREDGGRLLNVAVTRARQHLIILGDLQHLATSRDVGAFARSLVSSVLVTGRSIPVASLLPSRRAA